MSDPAPLRTALNFQAGMIDGDPLIGRLTKCTGDGTPGLELPAVQPTSI